MNRLRIIGSGNAFNLDGRAHACYLLEESLLLDCGASSPLRLRSLGVDFTRIRAVLLTHFHGDHIAGLPFLYLNFQFIEKRTELLHVLGPPGTEEMSRRLLDTMYPGMELGFPIEFTEIKTRASFESFEIVPYPISHKEESLGYRISWNGKTMAFSGDTAYDENLFELVRGVDLALVELSMFENDGSVAHVALSQLKGELQAKRIVYTHIFDRLAAAAEDAGFETASDGLEILF
jgi:ribonuclease BN (tRNA processing enzyme)